MENSINETVSDKVVDHEGKDLVEITINIEVADWANPNIIPFNAVTKLMQRLARKASEKLIDIFKILKDQTDANIRPSSNGESPDG